MHMRWPKVVPVLGVQESAHRTVCRYGIPCRLDASEAEFSIGVCRKLAPQVHLRLFGVLILIQADRRRVPDIDLGSGNRPAFLIAHPTFEEQSRPGSRRPQE